MPPLTASQKMRRYREKLKNENPEKYEEQRKKNLARIKSKKKKISEMDPVEAEAKREEWRKEKRISRQRHQDMNRKSLVLEEEGAAAAADSNIRRDVTEDKKLQKIKSKLKLSMRQTTNCNAQIKKLKTKVERYKKRFQRLQLQSSKSIASLQKSLDIVKARNEVLESTLRSTYLNCTKNSEKQQIKKVVHNSKNKLYTSKVLGLKVTARQKRKKTKRLENLEIIAFYIRDDVSRITSGKKEVRVKNKQKKQIRYLVDSIPNLYMKYRAEGGRYGMTTFYKEKPYFILSPNIHSRSTCLCEKHDNIKFQFEALRRHHIVNESFDEILKNLVCDTKKITCMYNTCNECKNNTPNFATDQDILEKSVNWFKWERQDHVYTKKGGTTVHTKKTVRATKTDTVQKLVQDFSRAITSFKKHHYNCIHQQQEYQKAVSNMKSAEAVIVCDFSENYECKLSEEIQSMHFGASKSQISLHTGMIYFKDCCQSFVTMSDNLCHTPPGIWAHLTPILATVKEICPDVDVIHYHSDGPSSQYRQKHNFLLHSLFTKEMNLSYSTWSYFEAGHGKSVADGIGGTIKRMLDFKVSHGTDIKNAKDAYEAVKQTRTIIQVHLIGDDLIDEISKKIPDNIPTLPGTMQIHQIIASDGDKIKYRDVSCFCKPLRGNCLCFSPGEHTLQKKKSTTTVTKRKKLTKCDIPDKDKLTVNLLESPPCKVKISESVKELQNSSCIEPSETIVNDCVDELSSRPVNPLNYGMITQPPANYGMITQPPADSFHVALLNETTSFDTVDMEGIKDFVDSSSDIVDYSDLDINVLPLIISPEKISTSSPGPSTKKDNNYLKPPKSCSSKKITRNAETKPKKNKIKFQICCKCSCSILGRNTKCMACKQFYCEDCTEGPASFDYICDSCFIGENSD